MLEDRRREKNGISWITKNFPGFFVMNGANMLLGFMLAFLVGIIIGLLINVFDYHNIILLGVILFWLIVYFFKHTNFKILLILLIFIGVIFGIFRANLAIQKSTGWLGMNYDGIGRVVRFPEPKNDYQRVYMEIMGQRKEGRYSAVVNKKEVVLLFMPLGVNYEYGKNYKLKCKLKTAENKYDKFNYQRFLASKKVYQICSGARITTGLEIESNRVGVGNNSVVQFGKLFAWAKTLENIKIKILRGVYNINKILEERISVLFPMPESAYLAGLLLGGDNRLPEDVSENFRRTGTTHTVAVSGYNITILANIFMWIGIGVGLWRKQAFWFVVSSIALFVIMIGAPSSAVRAGIMGVVLLYAAQTGRLANSVRVIILTAVIMICISPFIILYDAGFQLSFLATLGIILIYGPLSEKFKIENDFLGIKSIVLVTFSAQLGVLGILIYTFDGISLISLLANVIILPALPLIMLGGALAVGGSFIFNILGNVFALPTWAMLHLEISSIEQLSKFPWAIVEFQGVNIWWGLGYYLLLSISLIVIGASKRR